jgi:RNA 3'-terminal phosphate cyclase
LGFTSATVTENRAPTDESVRLLKEMEEKARDNIIESISVRDSQVECQILKERDFMSAGMRYTVVYSINGKKSAVKFLADDLEMPKSVAEKLTEMVCFDIAKKMLVDAFAKVIK